MPNPRPQRRNPGPSPALLRQIHTYLGVFIAPSVLFFCLTGSLQLFSLHEAHGGYQPPALIEQLGSVHKDQVFALKGKRPGPPAKAAAAEHHHADGDGDDHPHAKPGPKPATLALKWFFLLVAAGLATSTAIGLWMAFRFQRRKAILCWLLAAGAAAPLALLLF